MKEVLSQIAINHPCIVGKSTLVFKRISVAANCAASFRKGNKYFVGESLWNKPRSLGRSVEYGTGSKQRILNPLQSVNAEARKDAVLRAAFSKAAEKIRTKLMHQVLSNVEYIDL